MMMLTVSVEWDSVSGVALGTQTHVIRDCQLSASESPVAGQQARHARLGGPSGLYHTNTRR